MRTFAAIVATTILIGVSTLVVPALAGARVNTGTIAKATMEIAAAQPRPVNTHFSAQRRTQRARHAQQRPRAASGNPVTTIESTYRDPSSRGALLNCSFC